jgi:methionine-rich copper-binding protein CopC
MARQYRGVPRGVARWLAQSGGLLALALLGACGGGGGGGSPAPAPDAVMLSADVYPLAEGNRRSWRITSGASSGSVRSERVQAAVATPSGSAFPLRSDDGSVEYEQRSGNSIFSVPGPESDALTTALGAIEVLRFGAPAGQTLVLLDRTVSADADGDGRPDGIDFHVESTFIGYETLTTAAGTFTGAAHVRSVARLTVRLSSRNGASTTSTLTSDDWYAPAIGPVRSVSSTVTDGAAAQNETEEVYAYGVGSLHSDNVAPVLVSALPAAGAYATPTPRLELNFSKPLDPLTLDGSTGIGLFDAAGRSVATTRTLAQGGQQVVLAVAQPLADGRYELRTGNAVTDLANNPLPVSVRAFVVDTQGPVLVASTPADGATSAALTGNLVFTFNEPVSPAPGTTFQVQILDGIGQPLQSLPASVQGGNTVVATLATPLARNTAYLLRVSPLVDAAGNFAPYATLGIGFRTDPGPLSRPTPLLAGADVQAVAAGDINGDGRRDLVFVAQQIGSSVFFVGARLQQIDGRYAEPVRIFTLATSGICQARSLVVADFNGDGRADIAITGCGGIGSGVTVLLQQAGGSFAAEAVPADLGSFRVAAADLDGSGLAALLTQTFTDMRFLRRSASGAWNSALTVDGGTSYIAATAVADIDGDGRADLVWVRTAADGVTAELAWALRSGSGFGAVQSRTLAAPIVDVKSLVVADISGDARRDAVLVLTNNDRSQIAVLRGSAGGGFDAPELYASTYYAATVTVGDVDGDGRPDLVVTHSTMRQLGVYLQGSDGRLQAERLFEASYAYYEFTDAVVLADLDADGHTDIVAGNDVILGRAIAGAWPLRAEGRAQALSATAGEAASAPAPAPRAAPSSRTLRRLVPKTAAPVN